MALNKTLAWCGTALLLASAVLGSCSGGSLGPVSPSSDVSVAPSVLGSSYDVWVNNPTPLSLVVMVNGLKVGTVAPTVRTSFSAATMPALPWSVEVDAANGLRVLSFPVSHSSVSATTMPGGGAELHGAGMFVDLACGRIDAWVGPPLDGPVPLSSPPSCDPFLA